MSDFAATWIGSLGVPFGHQIVDDTLKVVGVNLVAVEGLNATSHEIEVLDFARLGTPSLRIHLASIFLDPFHLLVKLHLVVVENPLPFIRHFVLCAAENGIKDPLAPLLTVVNAETNLHILGGLQVASCQPLEEVKDDVYVSVFVFVTVLLNGRLRLLATLDQLEEFFELYVSVIVDFVDHLLDLFTRVDETQGNERIF